MATATPLIAAGGLADLGYQEEIQYGVLPVAPALKTFRRRSTTLALGKDSYQSEEVRSDRMTSDSRHGTRRVSGDIVAELSPGSHADAWEAELGGYWDALAAQDLSVTNAVVDDGGTGLLDIDLNASPVSAGLRVGDVLVFAGSGNADLDGVPLSITAVDDGTQTVSVSVRGDFDKSGLPVTLSAGTLGLKGARIEMGNIPRSFVFERAFSDIGSFITYRGCIFNSAAVDLPATGIATATFGLIGKDADPIAAASYDGVAQISLDEGDLTTLTFDAAAGTATAAAGDFVAAGIQAGDRVIFDGAGFDGMPQNRNPRTVIGVTATVLTLAEAVQSGVTTGAFTVTRVGLPAYAAAPNDPVLVAVSGVLLIDGQRAGTVTAANFTIDNQMAGSEVVGENTIPKILFGLRCNISGSLTVLFDRGGLGEDLYNAFDGEVDVTLSLRLDSADGGDFLAFTLPRVAINSGTIGDAVAEGLPVSVDFMAKKPLPASGHVSQIVIQDSTVTGI